MEAPNCERVNRRLPIIALLMIGSAILVALIPGAASWLVYDREAILHGQLWRLFTGNWVHFSKSHLVYDATALGIAGCIIESRQVPRFLSLCLTTPWVIGAGLLLFEPDFRLYGGLSGMAIAAVVFLALSHDTPRFIRLAIGAGVAIKVFVEITSGQTVLAHFGATAVIPAVASHVAGAFTAILWSRSAQPGTIQLETRKTRILTK